MEASSAAWATPHGACAHVDPARLQAAHHLTEPHVLLAADEVLSGDAEVLEKELAGVEAAVAQLVQVAAHLEAGAAVFLNDEGGQATVLEGRVRVGAGQQAEGVARLGVGDEHLGAVDHVLLAVLDGAGLQRADVAAAARLGEGQAAAHLPAGQARQELVPLLLGAVVGEHVGQDVVGAQRAGERHVAFADLLEDHGEGGVVQPHAAVLFRHVDAEQPQLLHLVDELVGDGVVGVVVGGGRLHLAADEVPHHADDLVAGLDWSLGYGGRLGNRGHGGSCAVP